MALETDFSKVKYSIGGVNKGLGTIRLNPKKLNGPTFRKCIL